MKLVSYDHDRAGGRAGVVIDDHVVALDAIDRAPTDLTALLAAGADVVGGVARRARLARERTPLAELTLRAPIARPSKYLAIGFNCTSHLEEIRQAAQRPEFAEPMQRFDHLRQAFPDQRLPTFFNKQVSCITGPFDPVLAPGDSEMLDYEGPWIVTADELDPSDLGVRTWVDGELRQDGSTAEMVTGIAEMIAAVSQVCTLEPGDLIATGTPGGVGAFSGRLLAPGQRVRVEVEGIGAIENEVVAEPVAGTEGESDG